MSWGRWSGTSLGRPGDQELPAGSPSTSFILVLRGALVAK